MYVFCIVGECFSSAAGTHLATDLTCKVLVFVFVFVFVFLYLCICCTVVRIYPVFFCSSLFTREHSPHIDQADDGAMEGKIVIFQLI